MSLKYHEKGSPYEESLTISDICLRHAYTTFFDHPIELSYYILEN